MLPSTEYRPVRASRFLALGLKFAPYLVPHPFLPPSLSIVCFLLYHVCRFLPSSLLANSIPTRSCVAPVSVCLFLVSPNPISSITWLRFVIVAKYSAFSCAARKFPCSIRRPGREYLLHCIMRPWGCRVSSPNSKYRQVV